MKARIYTLDNGLKVYLTVNKETPRIQTYIAVTVGGKNDLLQTTGLAHYFEHLMFKGTQKFGTQNYEAEKPLLDGSNNCLKYTGRLRMRLKGKLSTIRSTAYPMKHPNMRFPMSTIS